MIKIENTKHFETYLDNNLINNYIVILRKSKQSYNIYIGELKAILCKYPIIYKLDKCKMLNIPYNTKIKSFIYDDTNEIKIQPLDTIYTITGEEFIQMFQKFIKLDNNFSNITDFNFK